MLFTVCFCLFFKWWIHVIWLILNIFFRVCIVLIYNDWIKFNHYKFNSFFFFVNIFFLYKKNPHITRIWWDSTFDGKILAYSFGLFYFFSFFANFTFGIKSEYNFAWIVEISTRPLWACKFSSVAIVIGGFSFRGPRRWKGCKRPLENLDIFSTPLSTLNGLREQTTDVHYGFHTSVTPSRYPCIYVGILGVFFYYEFDRRNISVCVCVCVCMLPTHIRSRGYRKSVKYVFSDALSSSHGCI